MIDGKIKRLSNSDFYIIDVAYSDSGVGYMIQDVSTEWIHCRYQVKKIIDVESVNTPKYQPKTTDYTSIIRQNSCTQEKVKPLVNRGMYANGVMTGWNFTITLTIEKIKLDRDLKLVN